MSLPLGRYRSEARAAKKRAVVLAHQSALLTGELPPDERLARLLQELDSLRDALDDQATRHRDQLHELQVRATHLTSRPRL